jgi:fumarate hydratase subunit beta
MDTFQAISITTPLTDAVIESLHVGDRVSISGIIYTGRDTAHKRFFELLESGEDLPIDLKGQVIYYVGPAPAKPGMVIGSAGPTTSGRMDIYTPALIENGLKGMIGKGMRSQYVVDAMKQWKAIYFGATGGAAALISKCIKKSEIVAYEDLGVEAVRRLEVKDFPAIVINDMYGGDLYEEGIKVYKDR